MLALFLLRIIVSRKICKVSGTSVSEESKKFEGEGYLFLEYTCERISLRIILAASSTTLVRSCSVFLHLLSYHASYKILCPVPLKDKIIYLKRYYSNLLFILFVLFTFER